MRRRCGGEGVERKELGVGRRGGGLDLVGRCL